MNQERGYIKQRQGRVISDKMNKTRVVQVERLSRNPLYGKIMKKFSKFKVHDEENKTKTGDKVIIAETRPLSKEKRWRIVEVVK